MRPSQKQFLAARHIVVRPKDRAHAFARRVQRDLANRWLRGLFHAVNQPDAGPGT